MANSAWNQYPLFGAPFNEVIDYGFDNESLIYPFIKNKQKPSIHDNYYWKCSDAYCLYNNKDANHNQKTKNMELKDYVHSNPIDIIHSKNDSEFICHSTGQNQNVLRICQLNGNQKLKHGSTFNLNHQIEGISHCYNHSNDKVVIMSWNRNQIIYLAMNGTENDNKEYEFDIIKEFEAPSKFKYKSGALCQLPYVWGSGLEDTVFFTCNGDLQFFKNRGKTNSSFNLNYQEIPHWSEIIWTQHPRIIRFCCDVEVLTIDLRLNMNKNKLKCAQKHLFFDPITAISSYKNYMTTVGHQGIALYDDRMLKKPLSKWKFYDFDYSMGDGLYSRLQIYPLNDKNDEHWIICSGRSQRALIYPFFAKTDSPIKGTMPFNINKYIQCFGTNVEINSMLAYKHKDKHHIISCSEYGSILCTEFKLTQCDRKYNKHKYNTYHDHMFNNKEIKEINDDDQLRNLEIDIKGKKRIKPDMIYKKWSKQINDYITNDDKYANKLDLNKLSYLTNELENYSQQILKFTEIPRTIDEIRKEFKDILIDLQDLTLFDYFKIFKSNDIGLTSFQIESITNIDSINEDGINENMLEIIITYFVSNSLENKQYILIQDDIIENDEHNHNNHSEKQKENKDKMKKDELNKDELNLDEFFELSEIAASQDITQNSHFDSFPIYNDISGHSMEQQEILNDDNSLQDNKLFNTKSNITDKCQNLMDSLCNKWFKGEDNYALGDWRIQNGNNMEYNGMIEKRGFGPKRLKRGPKRVW